jgi:hypothetical protein
MVETWLSVVGYEGKYEVSDEGRVKSLLTNKVLKPSLFKSYNTTYHRVDLYDALHVQKHMFNHILVLTAFVSPRPSGLLGLHKNGTSTDNKVANLYWGSHKDNSRDMVAHGNAFLSGGGENHAAAKYPDETILAIIAEYTGRWGCQSKLAAKYGVSKEHVSAILRGKYR